MVTGLQLITWPKVQKLMMRQNGMLSKLKLNKSLILDKLSTLGEKNTTSFCKIKGGSRILQEKNRKFLKSKQNFVL